MSDYTTLGDLQCESCHDDPCCCRDCDVCYEPHHRDDLHRWNHGEELLCDECNETRIDDQLRWVGIKPSSNPVDFFEACSGPGRPAEQFPKRCGCGAQHDRKSWEQLPLVGEADYDGERLQLRNCQCHSTLAIEVAS